MFQITSLRFWIGVSLAWPVLWILIFDRWFFWTPMGLLIAFGIPIAGWLMWWKYYEGDGEKLLHEGKVAMAKSTIVFNRLKKQIGRKRASNSR